MIDENFRQEPDSREMLLEFGEQLGIEVYERFTEGRLTLLELEDVYATLTEWRRLSEKIITVLTNAQ